MTRRKVPSTGRRLLASGQVAVASSTASGGTAMRREGSQTTYDLGDYVTVTPTDDDPWILHMQRQVRVDGYRGGGYMLRLEAVDEGNRIQGPIPVQRLAPGWVELDGRVRADVLGRPA
jgi:hypothetical protein